MFLNTKGKQPTNHIKFYIFKFWRNLYTLWNHYVFPWQYDNLPGKVHFLFAKTKALYFFNTEPDIFLGSEQLQLK